MTDERQRSEVRLQLWVALTLQHVFCLLPLSRSRRMLEFCSILSAGDGQACLVGGGRVPCLHSQVTRLKSWLNMLRRFGLMP
jgi:hypothetical protein